MGKANDGGVTALDAQAAVHELEVQGNAVRYNRWRVQTVAPYLGRVLLEVGGGLGDITRLLLAQKQVQRIITLEPEPACLKVLREQFRDCPAIEVWDGDICDPALAERLAQQGIDTVVCLNVLEHIPNDVAALHNIHRILEREGGNVVIFSPASPALYGAHDRLMGHYRRYSLASLRTKLAAAGFRVTNGFYFNSVGWLARYLQRAADVGQTTLRPILLYDWLVVPPLAWLERRLRPPLGQSLVMVAEAEVWADEIA
ncbi:MAG: methyltransferase domain-containing protein [Chloroflexi bacterium]|nr:methyltransferase domain-containing protein [Chloroflexota bacterium]